MPFTRIPLLAVLLFSCSSSNAGEQAEHYSIKQLTPDTGSNIVRNRIDGDLPFDKTYAQLTVEQRRVVRAEYENLAEEDEPPFPLLGLGPLYTAISDAQQRLNDVGTLVVHVQVDSAGKATSVSVLDSPSQQMTQFVAHVAMLTRFKPAICAGAPCPMQFPLRINMLRRW